MLTFCCLCPRKLQHFPVNYGFHSKFEYSNYPYVLAGYVTEQLRGKTWEDDATDTLFKALGTWAANQFWTKLRSSNLTK